MSINVKKSSCIRIGHRYNVACASIMTSHRSHGQPLQWVSEFRYLGVGYLLFHRDLLNVHLCMLNVLSTPRSMGYLEATEFSF